MKRESGKNPQADKLMKGKIKFYCVDTQCQVDELSSRDANSQRGSRLNWAKGSKNSGTRKNFMHEQVSKKANQPLLLYTSR